MYCPWIMAIVILAFGAPAAALAQPAAPNPVDLVDPFVGTGGTDGVGLIDDFPGASAPFGMVQWSPDTPSSPPSGGYFYRDKSITGFSLTHVSGAGCQIFGDFAVLPTIGDIGDPLEARQPFTHAAEQASPGFYSVRLGAAPIDVQLAATRRAGIGSFTFPATSRANLLINAASDQAGVSDARIDIVNANEVTGWASSGGFCSMPNVFTVYFDMQFDRPFIAHGTWGERTLTPDAINAQGPQAGAWVTFDTTADRTVRVKAAVSYVDVDGARANVLAGARSWDVPETAAQTAAAWSRLLGEVRITGGTPDDGRMLFTSLYHALLSPTLYSDANGSYRGFDDRIHRDPAQHDEYTNFSGWDIYRTQVPLMALLAPSQTSDMMQSLVHAAQQGGWLPKWPVANGYTGVMGGDPADAIIAEAYAFGARNFDRSSALSAMVKGASSTAAPLGQDWYHPRPGLAEYLRRGYVVNAHTTSVSPVPNGASETLEYAYDDFSIAQFARSIGRGDVYRRFRMRAQNWATLFNTSTGLIAPRDGDGAFMNTPITENGQSGFQEGNAAQYTWMIPQAPGSLVGALGGPAVATERLDQFFGKLNAGQSEPYAWMGNEPSLISPWTYVYAGAPYRAQAIIRQTMRELYAPTPDGIPGNDDLGTMSAWWAWSALGVYPGNPAVPVLYLDSPLFTHVTIVSPSGKTIDLDAPQASRDNPYITAVRLNDRSVDRVWAALPDRGTLRVRLTVAALPNTALASSLTSQPPQYAPPILRFPASTPVQLTMQEQALNLQPGETASMRFAVRNPGSSPVGVTWNAAPPAGITVLPNRGSVRTNAQDESAVTPSLSAAPSLERGLYNLPVLAKADNGAVLQRVVFVVRAARPDVLLPLAYVANFSDGTVTPFDERTFAFGVPIAVGKSPGGLTFSANGNRLFTANQNSNDVTVVDTRTFKVLDTIKVGHVPAGIHATHDGKTVWVTNFGDGTLQAIDAGRMRAGRPIAIGLHPEELAIAPDDARVYVVDQGSSELAVYDVPSHKVVGSVAVGRRPLGVAVSPDGSRVYVTNSASNDVSVVDAVSLRVVAAIPVGKTPQGLAISPNGRLIYVANSASMSVTPIDVQTNGAHRPIAVGNGPFDVIFGADGRYAFVAVSGDNDCAVVDVASGKQIAAIPTGNFPITLTQSTP